MPLLGAIGNASEYAFRGTYDNYPFDIDFVDLIDAEPGKIYTTGLKTLDGINYKVPISISGDGEYYIGNVAFDKTFDNNYITFNQTTTTFDTTFPELDYTTQPTYVRNGNTIGLRIFGVPPTILNVDLLIVPRGVVNVSEYYSIYLNNQIEIDLRSSPNYTFNPGGSIQIQARTFQGDEIISEYYDKTYSTTITIGKRDFTWTVKTKKATSPQNLSFTNQTDVDYSSEIISDTYTVQGLTDSFEYTADITSNEGLLSVNYGDFVNSSSVKNGDILRLKLTSSSLNTATKSATVRIALTENSNIGSATTTWSLTTLDSIPSNLSFTDVPSAELNSQVLSDIIKIDGLSDGIDFNVSVTSTDGLLSVNSSQFVKSATIKNGDQLQLRVDTSSVWFEEKNVVVQLANTSTTWKVTNRTIQANFDINADKLIFALPLQNINETEDVSPDVRVKSGLAAGLQANAFPTVVAGKTSPSISTGQSKFYGDIGSLQIPKGLSTTQFQTTQLKIITDSSQSLDYSDFTIEMWVYLSGFEFNGQTGISLFYPNYYDNENSYDYFFQLYLKGDNWVNNSNFKRGILLSFPNEAGTAFDTLTETTSQVLSVNTWNHIAITRQGTLFRIFVNGILRGSGSKFVELTSSSYSTMINNFQVLLSEDVYVQDFRMYKGIAKYTSNFNVSNVTSIMEPYNSPIGDFYVDSAGRILILSVATPEKDPRTLSKTNGAVLPGTDSCIDDTRWQNFLSLAASGENYRLAVTEDQYQSTTKITNVTPNNIQRMLNANVLPLRNSLTDWQNGNLAHDETDGSSITGSDYSLLRWLDKKDSGFDYSGFGYYGISSNPFFENPSFAYFYKTANWWILPPGVPDF